MGNGTEIDLRALYQLMREISSAMSEFSTRFREIDHRLTKIEGLGEAVAHYRSSMVGHGIQLSELDKRIRRIEERLDR